MSFERLGTRVSENSFPEMIDLAREIKSRFSNVRCEFEFGTASQHYDVGCSILRWNEESEKWQRSCTQFGPAYQIIQTLRKLIETRLDEEDEIKNEDNKSTTC